MNREASQPLTITKRQHKIYSEWIKSRKEYPHLKLVGRWQFIYSSIKGEISLVKFIDYFPDVPIMWEIYCLKGDLFKDVERFKTKQEAETRIKELL